MPRELRDEPESWPVVATEDFYRTDWVMALRQDELRRAPMRSALNLTPRAAASGIQRRPARVAYAFWWTGSRPGARPGVQTPAKALTVNGLR